MKLNKQDYTVGWICALPIEKAAAIAVLDEKHDELPAIPNEEDSNIHTVGRIGKHNVVIVCLPAGNYGTNSAATVATNLRRSFPSLRFGLMVGIGGGVPNDENDVRLGDIVVSQPLHGTSGVVQYDLGKKVGEDTFHRTGWLNAPPEILLQASASLQADKSPHNLGDSITAIAMKVEERDDRFCYPDSEDHLYHSNYPHSEGSGRKRNTCTKCDPSKRVIRDKREHDNPVVHYGIIASGNQVIKNAIARDKIGKEAKAICFEMEAAGLMNHFPCLVIRGICDYSDSHKNKAWQSYAAITAAAYTKELLSHVPAFNGLQRARTDEIDVSKSIQALSSVSRDPEVEKAGIERRKDKIIDGSYQWVKDHQVFKDWLVTGPQILHLIGGAGKGKTMIMIGIINEFESSRKLSQEEGNQLQTVLCLPQSAYVSYFLCQGTNEHLNSAVSVLKGLLLLLLRKHHNLAIHLQKRYDLIGPENFSSMVDINECFVDNQDLMAFIRRSVEHSPRIKWLLSSRPNQDILSNHGTQKICAEILLEENQDSIDVAIAAYIGVKVTELDIQKHYRLQDKEDLENALREKCGGTFLWVHLACKELESSHALSCETLSILEQMPLELTSVYTRMLEQIKHLDIKTCGRCFDILATAAVVYRPLRLEEMGSIAIRTDHLPDVERLLRLCGSFLSIENHSVHFIHQSAKDYLVSEHSGLFTTAGTSSRHKTIFDACILTLSNPAILKKDLAGIGWPGTLYSEITEKQRSSVRNIEYTCCYWARHLESFTTPTTEARPISKFFHDYFLHWLEALAILGTLSDALSQIDILQAIKWDDNGLQEIVLDAREFLMHNFSRIEQSPLQIYSSALIFTPRRSLTRVMGTHKLSKWLDPGIGGSSAETWDPSQKLILQGLQYRVESATYSPDGKFVAALCPFYPGQPLTVKVWNALTGLSLHVYPIPEIFSAKIHFSPDSKVIAIALSSGDVQILDVVTGCIIISLETGFSSLTEMVFSENSKFIGCHIYGASKPLPENLSASTYGTTWEQLQVWDLTTNKLVKRFTAPGPCLDSQSLHGLFFSSQNKLVGLLLDKTKDKKMLWDLDEDRVFRVSANSGGGLLHGNSRTLFRNAVISPNGEIIVWCGLFAIHVWRSLAGEQECCHQVPLAVTPLVYSSIDYISFSNDSKLLLVVLDSEQIQILDTTTWECIHTLESSEFPMLSKIRGAEFCPNDSNLAIVSCSDGTVRMRSLVSDRRFKVSQSRQHLRQIYMVSISPDSRFAASLASKRYSEMRVHIAGYYYAFYKREHKEAMIWNALQDQSTPAHTDLCDPEKPNRSTLLDLAFNSKDNTLISYLDKHIQVWDPKTGTCIRHLDLPQDKNHSDEGLITVNVSHDGSVFTIPRPSTGILHLWSRANGECLHAFPLMIDDHDHPIIEFSPNDKYIAINRWDGACGSFEIRDTNTGESIGLFGEHSRAITSITFSSRQDLVASASLDGDIQLFSLEGKYEHRYQTTSGSIPHFLCIHRLKSVKYRPNVFDDTELHGLDNTALDGHPSVESSCIAIAFSPNGESLVVAGCDENIQLWNIKAGRCVKLQGFKWGKPPLQARQVVYVCLAEPTRIEFSDDSNLFVWGNAGSTRRIIIPASFACLDDVGMMDVGGPRMVVKNSIFLSSDGLYVHGRRLLEIPAAYTPVAFDYRNGVFAIGSEQGHVYFIKLNVDHLLDPVA
ncbi:hypothetical protein TWF506_004156 [Arthrobotrys conoides]|uniref:Nephrocystin 3-like N-terminal domain-containing protein n=1 Tax=Arthrobotrys conoides TaxID=74498 RepID=A0AAN8NAZ9_9PEZI